MNMLFISYIFYHKTSLTDKQYNRYFLNTNCFHQNRENGDDLQVTYVIEIKDICVHGVQIKFSFKHTQ